MEQKSKIEIMAEVWDCLPDDLWVSLPQSPQISFVEKAMDIWAKQEAIEFGRWLNENSIKSDGKDFIVRANVNYVQVSADEAFNLYLQTKEQK